MPAPLPSRSTSRSTSRSFSRSFSRASSRLGADPARATVPNRRSLGRLMLGVGAAIVAVVLGLRMRDVDRVEVLGVALFLAVLLGILLGGARGGTAGAALATVVYATVRTRDADVIGDARVVRLVLSRGVGFLVFGIVGGSAYALVRRHLSSGSAVDHDTGLSNAPALGELFDLEVARAHRFGRTLSVVRVTVEVPRPSGRIRGFRPTGSNHRNLLADLGSSLRAAVRTIDRIGIVSHPDRIELAAVLPETPAAGGERVADRIAASARVVLAVHALGDTPVHWVVHASPAGDHELSVWRASLVGSS